jgi:hypothetical protein
LRFKSGLVILRLIDEGNDNLTGEWDEIETGKR